MDIYGSYKSPFGYENGDNGVDSYGVDHSGFSTQDELQYQAARTNREQQLANNLQQQGGAEENYPQYGLSFWGNSANNYGFGVRNIAQNAQNHPAMNMTPMLITQTIQGELSNADEVAGIVFDNGVVQGQPTAIMNLQKALGVKADGIIGSDTLEAAKNTDYKTIRGDFINNVNQVEDQYQKNDPSQIIFERGHRKRYSEY